MPKSRRRPFNYTYKPSFHPPPSGSSQPRSLTTAPTAFSNSEASSVNERLNHLRLTQQFTSPPSDGLPAPPQRSLAPAPTVHPSLQALFGVANTPPPQPRALGFAVPNSWRSRAGWDPYQDLRDGESTTSSASGFEARGGTSTFPNFEAGQPDSIPPLVSLCLRAVARNWAFHVAYDRYFLRELRPTQKSLLLEHLAAYTLSRRRQRVPEAEILAGSLDKASFELLFRAPFPAAAAAAIATTSTSTTDGGDTAAEALDRTLPTAGTEHITHISFAGAIGYSISLKEVFRLLTHRATPSNPAATPAASALLDSWEDFLNEEPAHAAAAAAADVRTRSFENLTSLSLAYPRPSAAPFTDLLKLAADAVPTITHLSLAGWRTTAPDTPGSGGGGGESSQLDRDAAACREALYLKHLSQSLICLRYLDVSDCDAGMYRALEAADWLGCWRKVDVVAVRQGRALSAGGLRVLKERTDAARQLEGVVRGLRRTGGGELCRFEYSPGEDADGR